LQGKLIKAGIDPRQPVQQYQSVSPSVVPNAPKGDWRLLDENDRNRCRHQLTASQIMSEFHVSRATAFEWKKK
jgi:hypothetical protein